jgi:hypothetical protein
MVKNAISDYSSTAASNTDVGGVNIDEGMSPSGVNNAIRELMSHLADLNAGTSSLGTIKVDNLQLDGNAITSTDTNGNISLTPNGTGSVVLDGINYPQADGTADYLLKTDGAGQLSFAQVDTASIAADAIDGTKIADDSIDSEHYVDGSIDTAHIADNAVGATQLNVSGDGTSGQVLSSDGDGTFSWADAGGGLRLVQSDTFDSSGTWNKNADANLIFLRAVGAGGGIDRVGGAAEAAGGGGGGGGSIIIECGGNDLGNTQTVTIGAGGVGNDSGTDLGQGGTGGTTTFGNLFTLNGGVGGIRRDNSNAGNGGNDTGTAAGGTASTNLSVAGNVTRVATGNGGTGAGAADSVVTNANGGSIASQGVSGRGGGAYYDDGTTSASGTVASDGFLMFSSYNLTRSGATASRNSGISGQNGYVLIQQYGDI